MKKKLILTITLLITLILTLTTQAALTDDLFAFYGFDSDATDPVNGNDGTVTGATHETGCHIGGCYDFDGTGDYITLPTNFSATIENGDLTINTWVNWTSGDTGYLYTFYADSNLRTGWNAPGTMWLQTNLGSQTTSTVGVANTWVMLTWTWDGTNMTVYKNGVYTDSWAHAGPPTTNSGTANNLCANNVYGGTCTGQIDEFGVWNRSLSQSEITQLYNSGSGLAYPFTGGASGDVTAQSSYNESTIYSFNITLDNGTTTTYTTTNGTIELNNESGVYNITGNTENHWSVTIQNWDVSNALQINFTTYPQIHTWNNWTGEQINTFNVTINSTTYTTTNGVIYVPYNDTYNITYQTTNYISQTNEESILANTSINSTNLYQSVTTITAEEINTNNSVTNWTLTTEYDTATTITGSITIYPNLGTYAWNWTNTEGYHNETNISFTIDDPSESLTITNLFARNITFVNSETSSTITPSCTQDGYTYTSYDYLLPKSTSNLTCTLSGFQTTTLTLASMFDTSEYNMTPVQLNLIFTELTNGYVETSDCSSLPNSCDEFNATSIYINQANISTGYVTVKFNPDGSGNWQQIFKYYNDQDTHVKEYVLIETPDLVKTIKVSSYGNNLEEARVCAATLGTNPDTNETEWLTTYCEYTNVDGEALLLVNDQNTYKFTVQKEGYISNSEILFITPSESTTSKIELEPEEAQGGSDYIYSTCNNIVTTPTTCTLEIVTGQIYNEICISYNTNSTQNETCDSTTASATYQYTINTTNTNWEINVSLDGTLTRTFTHAYQNGTAYNISINYDLPDSNGDTFKDKLGTNSTYLITFYIIMTILGIIMGWMAEKYFEGYGIYGSAVFFAILGFAGFAVFYIGAGIPILRFITQQVLKLGK